MTEIAEKPELIFFRSTPDGLTARPPLSSSLQNIESSFLLLTLGRFPHALVTCAASIESAIKALLGASPDQFIRADELYRKALAQHAALQSFDGAALERFRFARNKIAHYGFSPRDDEESAALLLETGYPFAASCYREFFGFDLLDGLLVEYGQQLGIALRVYEEARSQPDLQFSRCFAAFRHLVRWGSRKWFMTPFENEAAEGGYETFANFDLCEKRKTRLEHVFGAAFFLDCPICDEIECLVCQIDEDRLEQREVIITRAVCANCDLRIAEVPFLANAVVQDQLAKKRTAILKDFGIKEP
jgi:hypothetical protein